MALQPNEQINIEVSQESGFLPFYHGLSEKPATTARIFDRTDFYTVHGEDALFAAKELFKTTAVIKNIGPEGKTVPSLVLNKANFEVWVRELLLIRQYRVEIYGNKGSAKNQDWFLKHKASPGNLTEFEEFLFAGGETINLVGVMAVKLGQESGQRVVGVGYVDRTTRTLLVCEFPDNDHFSNLETLSVQLGPSECLLSSGEQQSELAKIKEVLKKSAILITERKKADFQAKNIVQDLNRLLELEQGMETCVHMPELEKKLAMSTLGALISFLELMNEEENLQHYKLKTFDMSRFVRLDAAAVSALQLMPVPGESNSYQSLYGILNKCRTGQGQRLLAQWLKQPLMDILKIVERQDLVEAFVEDSGLRQLLYEDHLRKIPDFQKLARRFVKKKSSLQDCYKMYQALSKLPDLFEALNNHSGVHAHLINAIFCQPLTECMRDFAKYQEMIELTIDLSLVENDEYVIKAEFDEALAELREKISDLENNMKELLDNVVRDLGLTDSKTVKLDSNSQLGYFFRVTLKEEKILRGNRHYKIIDANKTGVRFHNSEMAETNSEYLAAREQYESQQKAVVNEVVGIACGYIEPMLRLSDIMAELDVLVSMAVIASMAPVPYVKPKILPKGSGVIRLIQARHPCLELQEDIAYIPNDSSFDNDKRFQIITGPNMGGKSTYMRTGINSIAVFSNEQLCHDLEKLKVGIAVLLAQMGSFVPCESAEISVVDAILTRIGCEDDHTRAMSTFMVEMVEIASILRVATKDSLLIIDELGRGTSTYDGFGLAWAISEKIASQIKSYCMFATHFHELTRLEEEVSSVQNLHVTATMGCNGPVFLYRIKPGVCDKSYGLHVAEIVRFPEEVLKFARLKAQELEDFQSSTLSEHAELLGDNSAAVKNRQQAKQEGEQIIFEFLNKVKQLNTSNMTLPEIEAALDVLKMEVESKNNAYVKDILSRPNATDVC